MEFTEEIAIRLVRRLLIVNSNKECIQQTLDGDYHEDKSVIKELDNLVINIHNQLFEESKNPDLVYN